MLGASRPKPLKVGSSAVPFIAACRVVKVPRDDLVCVSPGFERK